MCNKFLLAEVLAIEKVLKDENLSGIRYIADSLAENLPEGPGTNQRAGLIAVAERKSAKL